MPKLSLRNDDARVVYLATVYHLGRPGSETDADTLERHRQGLGAVRDAMEPAIERAVVELDLSEYQLGRLGEALLGTVNELKQYEMAQGRSVVPGFTDAITRLFPELREEPGAALDLAGQAVMLRRRLDAAVSDANAAVEAARERQAEEQARTRRRWWRPSTWRAWRR